MKKNQIQDNSDQILTIYEPETAQEKLFCWKPEGKKCTEPKHSAKCVLVDFRETEANIQQIFFRAFQNANLPFKLYWTDDKHIKKLWYRDLPVLTIEGITVELNGESMKLEECLGKVASSFLEVDAITVNTVIEDRNSYPSKEDLNLKTEAYIHNDDGLICDIPILLAKNRTLTVNELSELIVNSCYREEDDGGGYYSSKIEFEDEADLRARFLLLPEDIAVKDSIKIIIFQHFSGLLSPGMTINIKMVSTKEKLLDFEIDLSKK